MVFGLALEFRSDDAGAVNHAALPVAARCAGTMLTTRASFERVGAFTSSWRVGEFIDWYLRATDLGLRGGMLEQVVLYRRLHGENSGLTAGSGREDYVRIIKSALDRRRGA